MRLTKQTSYALRILIHCAVSGSKHVKAADIAAEHGITEFNVAKIVPILVRGGFIATSRGRTGGLKLARVPEEIGIGDVIRITEATHVEAECVGGTTLPCGIKRAAPINRMLGEALEAFIDVLDKHTLADLIGSRPRELRRRYKIDLKPRVVGASESTIRFADGSEIEVDGVVWATSYRSDYSWIEAPVLDGNGRPQPIEQLVSQGMTSRSGGNFSWLLKQMG